MKSEWEMIKLGEVATVKGGKRLPKGVSLITQANQHPYIRVRDLNENKIIELNSDYEYVDDETQKSISRYTVSTGDVVLSIVGTIGLVCMIGESLNEANLTENCVKLTGFKGINNDYLYYFLKSSAGQNEIAKGTVGAVQAKLPIKNIQNIAIPLPDLEMQEKVSRILNALDEKIALNQKINDNLEQQAQAIFKSWFVNFEPFGGVALDSWDIVTLEDMTSLVSRGIAPKYAEESDQVVLNQKCIRNHVVDLSEARTHIPKKINEKWLQYGDVLINSTGTGTLGRAAQVWFEPHNMTVDSHVTIVRPASKELIYYVGIWGITHEREIESLHTGSTGQTELPRDRVKAIELLCPDKDTLNRFNVIVAPMTAMIVENQEENKRLSAIRDTLLPKLMGGEIQL